VSPSTNSLIPTFSGRPSSDSSKSSVKRSALHQGKIPTVESHIPELPRIVALRNRLIHGYDSVDPALVWDLVENKVPTLMAHLKAVLKNP
jgi:uncharacterized protein YutE (UPF0331/DUF86 family)